MKRLILKKPGDLVVEEVKFDENIAPDEVLAKVHRVGVCGTDLHAYNGNQPFFTYPRVLGHELGLEVLKTGSDVTHVKPGNKCSLEPYFNTSSGQAVRLGKPNCGENISVFGVHADGGMQEKVIVPGRYLHASEQLDYDQLALVETLAIGYHAVQRAETKPSDMILVIGAGPIGLATIQFAKALGAYTVVMDINRDRLDFCMQKMGVDDVIHPENSDVQEIQSAFKGNLPTVVFDATGNPNSMMKAFHYPSHGGKLVFIGLFQGDVTFHDPLFHKKELTLYASRNALSRDFKDIISMIEKGEVDTRPWITHRSPLQLVPDVFKQWLDPASKVIKAMIEV